MQAQEDKVMLGSALCKLCITKEYWEVTFASFVVQSSIGKNFVQTLQYKVVMGTTLRNLCSTK